MFFIKLRWSSLGLIHMSAWTNFQLWSWVSNEKPKQTMEEWQSVAEFYTNYSNASIYLFNQFGELKWQFSSFLDPPQWPHTWFPLRVSISYRLTNHISMYFWYHDIETKANNFWKLNFRIWANGCFLAGLHVKVGFPIDIKTEIRYLIICCYLN